MKVKNALYSCLLIAALILISTVTLRAATNVPSYIPSKITAFMYNAKAVPFPLNSSTSLDADIRDNKISDGSVALAPEPATLLLLGTGLMGVALYRRLKNK